MEGLIAFHLLKPNFKFLRPFLGKCDGPDSKTRFTITLGRTLKFIPTLWYKRGGGGGSVFDMLQYFETILPLVESLLSSYQDEVYFMGGGAAGGL